jgi:hypothetical protein
VTTTVLWVQVPFYSRIFLGFLTYFLSKEFFNF